MTGKKSIILYVDVISTFEALADDEAGRLIKHFLRYVNDLNPTAPDKLTQIAFEPIKQQLKRDLAKWDEIKVKRSNAGKISAEKKQQNSTKSTHVEFVQQTSTKSTVTDNVNVTVNVTDTVNVKDTNTTSTIGDKSHKKTYDQRKGDFKKTLYPYTNKYGVEMCKAFFEYWAEPDKKERMRFEQEKFWDLPRRLATWKLNEDKKTNQNVRTGTIRQRNSTENIKSAALAILNRDNS